MFEHTKEKEIIQLSGFNNLQKLLSVNLYDFTIATNEFERQEYIRYIYERYSAEKLTSLLSEIANIINAEVLDISQQDFSPYGASSLLLLSDISASPQVNMHLNKSHISVHTYPDFESKNGVLSFRVDIDLSTCGDIIPLKALNRIFKIFDTDILVIDYLVRGFMRDINGKKIFNDSKINSISEYIDRDIVKNYETKDLILQNDNIWQLKMMKNNMSEEEYFHPENKSDNRSHYVSIIEDEMLSLFHNWSNY